MTSHSSQSGSSQKRRRSASNKLRRLVWAGFLVASTTLIAQQPACHDAATAANAIDSGSLRLAAESTPPLPSAAVAPTSSSAEASLPEDPGMLQTTPLRASTPGTAAPQTGNLAPHYAMNIASDERAQPLKAGDKLVVGLRDLYSPLTFLGIVSAAGYGQLVNGEPNYGTDRGAFGQRLGAAALRDVSQEVLTNGVFAPILHQDPRYYALGSNSSFGHRVVYAATRPLISRTDSGHKTINGAMLLGYAGTAALEYPYYPQINRNFKDLAFGFGGSLGGSALGYVVTEFSDDLLHAIHLRRKK